MMKAQVKVALPSLPREKHDAGGSVRAQGKHGAVARTLLCCRDHCRHYADVGTDRFAQDKMFWVHHRDFQKGSDRARSLASVWDMATRSKAYVVIGSELSI